MQLLNLTVRNLLRRKLRTSLTVLGIAVAVMAFGLLRTVIAAWHTGVTGAAQNRLIVRNAVAFIFPLPIAYLDKIASIPGVVRLSHATWFQGVYIDMQHFFPRMAVDANTYLDLYSEFLIRDEQLATFKRERNSCIIGAKIARQYGIQIGDIIPITGDIYPGEWEFVVRGIYHGKYDTTDETQMLFHWDYLEQRLRAEIPSRAGYVEWYVIQIDDPNNAAVISESIDKLFKNSFAETKTETEKAFQQGFVSMSSAIITSVEVISYVIVGIILLVLMNTMIMTGRERITEYAVLRTLGFSSRDVSGIIIAESLIISSVGGLLGLLFAIPVTRVIAEALSNFFPIFRIGWTTSLIILSLGMLVGMSASIFPVYRALRVKIVDALRQIE